MSKIISFIKGETVLCVALLLAAISCFFITPDAAYISYIDFGTLCLLFCLMAVMAGFQAAGVFSFCANSLLRHSSSVRSVVAVLVLLCFFFSAVITNDVALITFVPFAIALLKAAKRTDLLPFTVILQTVAANMGSCLTPLGNPQNIYLYSISGLSFADIFLAMLPYAAVTFGLLLLCILFIKSAPLSPETDENHLPEKRRTLLYALLFIVSLLGVMKVIHFGICFIISLAVLLVFDRKIIFKVDYSLLLTFVGFFIFVGNMGRLPFFRELIENLMEGKEILFSALASQFISNVPAALLLSGFTENYTALLIGVNIGGLGTLIASMASLISYKFVAAELPDKKGKYFLLFSALNFVLLAVMLALSCLL